MKSADKLIPRMAQIFADGRVSFCWFYSCKSTITACPWFPFCWFFEIRKKSIKNRWESVKSVDKLNPRMAQIFTDASVSFCWFYSCKSTITACPWFFFADSSKCENNTLKNRWESMKSVDEINPRIAQIFADGRVSFCWLVHVIVPLLHVPDFPFADSSESEKSL